jgi:hypothetical protein
MFVVSYFFNSVEDLIYQRRLKLSPECAENILNRCQENALSPGTAAQKGIRLEVLAAVLLSQIEGFEVTDVGISNRSQQLDVLVHNRNIGGVFANSPAVIAEAKNWNSPVGTEEYYALLRKLASRHGRAKLGFLVTTGTITAGVLAEVRRDSMNDTLIVLIDGQSLPKLWRGTQSITANVERMAMNAMVGN